MIYAITNEVRTALVAKGVPYPVVYGPERAPASVNETRIVIERDRLASDEIAAPMSPKINPRRVFVRWQAVQVWIYAQSTIDSPMLQDHERIAEQLADKVLIALMSVVRTRKNNFRLTSAHFVGAAELEALGLEQWEGVVYQISCAIDRSVENTTWAGVKAVERAVGGKGGVSIDVSDLMVDGTTEQDGTLPSAETELDNGSS